MKNKSSLIFFVTRTLCAPMIIHKNLEQRNEIGNYNLSQQSCRIFQPLPARSIGRRVNASSTEVQLLDRWIASTIGCHSNRFGTRYYRLVVQSWSYMTVRKRNPRPRYRGCGQGAQ